MCGRVACYSTLEEIYFQCKNIFPKQFDSDFRFKDADCDHPKSVACDSPDDSWNFRPKYNASPTSILPLIVTSKTHLPEASTYSIKPCKWSMPIYNHQSCLTNTRIETFREKKFFLKKLEKNEVGVLIINGYYEWQKVMGKHKLPHFIKSCALSPSLCFLACIVEGQTFSVITASSVGQSQLASIHHRMPVIFQDAAEMHEWLSCGPGDDASRLLEILESQIRHTKQCNTVQHYQVSSAVNSVYNNSEECIRPRAMQQSNLMQFIKH